jgi:hypothetical protein
MTGCERGRGEAAPFGIPDAARNGSVVRTSVVGPGGVRVRDRGARPGRAQAGLHFLRLRDAPLLPQRPREAREGPAVLGKTGQVLAIDPLRIRRTPRGQEGGAQVVAHRDGPLRRLTVEELVLLAGGFAQPADRLVVRAALARSPLAASALPRA